MLPPQGGLEVSSEALAERLQRRVTALERQLEARIAQVDDLRARLAQQERLTAEARGDASRSRAEADVLRPKAAEYEALMRTFTMRALDRPRVLYAAARRRVTGRSRP